MVGTPPATGSTSRTPERSASQRPARSPSRGRSWARRSGGEMVIREIVREGGGGGSSTVTFPTLTKTNYQEWAILMRIALQGAGLWEAVDTGDATERQERQALGAILRSALDEGLVRYVLEHPGAMWFVGPTFAALTGLVFKEGLCYGKLEAGILTFVIPILLLGYLSGLMDDGAKLGLLGVWMALFTVFAARKFQQPIKDDIGDKSVFMFNALPEEEKKALLQKLEAPTEQKFE